MLLRHLPLTSTVLLAFLVSPVWLSEGNIRQENIGHLDSASPGPPDCSKLAASEHMSDFGEMLKINSNIDIFPFSKFQSPSVKVKREEQRITAQCTNPPCDKCGNFTGLHYCISFKLTTK
uniref:Uncharacterized protein n=1 Tax=Parascaris univalens TaxID=6257 RepID=A0A915A118_PARUN